MTDRKRITRPLPDATRLRELFHYDPETGLLTRIAKSGNRGLIGETVGSQSAKGYRTVSIDAKAYLLHRVIYKWMTGEDPPEGRDIDHLNGDRGDCRWANLRVVSRMENNRNAQKSRNNTSGTTGVTWHSQTEKWHAQICVNYKNKSLGLFKDIEDAIAARKAAEEVYGFNKGHDRAAEDYSKMSKVDLAGRPHIGAAKRQSGIPRITWVESEQKWRTRFAHEGKRHYPGSCDTVEEALALLTAFKKKIGAM